MSLYNDKGQRHGYWELFYVKKNYHHGILHGKYEYYYDKEKTKLFGRGLYDMGEKVGLWILNNRDGNTYRKTFHL